MNILLDTHVLLWWLADDAALTKQARHIIQDSENMICVSAATAWEMSIKKSLGKLKAPNNIPAALEANGFHPLSITIKHAEAAGALPRHHDDPFDRMLIAQSQLESLTLLTHDSIICKYELPLLIV